MKAGSVLAGVRLVASDVVTITLRPRADGRRRSVRLVVTDLGDYGRVIRRRLAKDRIGIAAPAERLLAGHPDVGVPLRASAANSARRGELTAALMATRRLRATRDSKKLRTREAELEDRLRETDPAWLPVIDGPPAATPVRDAQLVLHLLKTSLPDRQSGYTIRSAATLGAQQAIGLRPIAVTPWGFPPRRDGVEPAAVETINGIPHHRLAPGTDTTGIPLTEQLSRTAALVRDLVAREGPAVLHAHSGHHGYDYGLVAAALKAHTGRPFVYEVRGFLEASWTSDPRIAPIAEAAELTQRRLATEARVMAAADGIATLGTAMRDELVARGVPEDKIVLVPNGIDPDAFKPTPRDPGLARALGVEGRWVFGYISNLDHFREGQGLLIDATAILVAEGRAVSCLIVGDGHRRAELEQQAVRAGVASSVVFTGRVPHDRVADHYALLDAFVIPRVPDRAAVFTTPLKPYEAMAMGLPLVVSDLPALTEIADPDNRGLAFAAGDAAALADRLRTLMDRPELAGTLGEAGRSWVLAERTWSANAARYRDLYARILERYPASSRS